MPPSSVFRCDGFQNATYQSTCRFVAPNCTKPSLACCSQAQLLLADQEWPPGLFPGEEYGNEKPQKPHRGSSTRIWNLDSGETGESYLGICLLPLLHVSQC